MLQYNSSAVSVVTCVSQPWYAYSCDANVLTYIIYIHAAIEIQLFSALFINWWMISQELHKYAHMRKSMEKSFTTNTHMS